MQHLKHVNAAAQGFPPDVEALSGAMSARRAAQSEGGGGSGRSGARAAAGGGKRGKRGKYRSPSEAFSRALLERCCECDSSPSSSSSALDVPLPLRFDGPADYYSHFRWFAVEEARCARRRVEEGR